MHELAPTRASAMPRASSWLASNCSSLVIVCRPWSKKPRHRHTSVALMTLTPSLPKALAEAGWRCERSAPTLGLEAFGCLHAVAHELVLGVAGRDEARDLQVDEQGRVGQVEQTLLDRREDVAFETLARDQRLGHVLEGQDRAQLALGVGLGVGRELDRAGLEVAV